MDKPSSNEKKAVKKITLGLILGWIFGVLFLLSGFTVIGQDLLNGLLYILIALIALPPVGNFIKEKANFSLSGGVKFVLIIVLLFIIGSRTVANGIGSRLTSNYTNYTPSSSLSQTSTTPSTPKEYIELFSFSGNGAKKSEPFTIDGDRFKVEYTCEGSYCGASLYKVGSQLPSELIMNAGGPLDDETIIYGSGEYYIDSNTTGAFTMTVFDYK